MRVGGGSMDNRYHENFENIEEFWEKKMKKIGIDILDDTINDHLNK